jgi:hypothetical protein
MAEVEVEVLGLVVYFTGYASGWAIEMSVVELTYYSVEDLR